MDASPSRKLRHVAIGAGANVFNMHRPALEQLETVDLVAVCDIRTDIGQQRADEMGCAFFADYRTMLAEMEPEVTVVMTPHPLHAPMTIDALNQGSHVLVEKPMAVHVAETDAMIAAARKNDRLLAVNFQHRQRAGVEAALDLIQTGQIGEIQRVQLVGPWMRTAAYFRAATWRGTWNGEGGGVLMNQAPHDLDLLCYLAGQPKRLSAWTRTLRHAIETEDTVLAMLEWENGALGTMFFSTTEAGPRYMDIVGSGGQLHLTENGLTFQRYDTDLREHIANNPNPFAAPKLEAMDVEMGTGSGDHMAVYQDFHRAILEGGVPRADGTEGVLSLELANAVTYASHAGGVVELPLDRDAYLDLLQRYQAKGRAVTFV
jgi:predicted dehydrogenase